MITKSVIDPMWVQVPIGLMNTFIMDKLWLEQKFNNRTAIGVQIRQAVPFIHNPQGITINAHVRVEVPQQNNRVRR